MLLTLAFTSAPYLKYLTLPAQETRRTVLQKVRGSSYKAVPQLVNTGFQVLFHSPPGVLFTFPSQYYALSVTKEYLALRGGPRSFPQGFSCLVVLRILLGVFPISCTRLSLSLAGLPRPFYYCLHSHLAVLTPLCSHNGLGSSAFARRYLRNRISFSSSGYLDVSVPRVPLHALWIGAWMAGGFPAGFPHSDICGSSDICSLPQLFAAYHVFLRLSVPRHPPCALSNLTFQHR